MSFINMRNPFILNDHYKLITKIGERTYSVVWRAVDLKNNNKLVAIKRISKSNRLFGAEPVPYFRIRKVFNPDILRIEMEDKVMKLMELTTGVYHICRIFLQFQLGL